MEKKRIIIDLDVVTISMWDKKGLQVEIANRFIERVMIKEFYVITPFFLLELISKWRYIQLRDYIENFYLRVTDKLLSNQELDDKIDSMNIDDKKFLEELKNYEIKGEDSLLVLVSSLYGADFLITFNRVHLRNKKRTINEVLKNNGLKPSNIIGPEEA